MDKTELKDSYFPEIEDDLPWDKYDQYDSEKEDQHEESSGLHSFEKSVQANVRTD